MAFIDGTVVNVAIPALQAAFKAGVPDVQWVVEAYSLVLTSLLLVGGSLGDRYGRRRMFLTGIALFSVASLGSALALNIQELIAARAFQGAGAALLVPESLAIIGASFDGQQRGRAIGTWAGFTAITTAIGPVIGGWLIEHFSWRGIFLINLPLALAVCLIALKHVPETRDTAENKPPDWPGAALITTGLGALVYGLIESSQVGFGRADVWTALIMAPIFLTAFFWFEGWTGNPMLPLALFRSRNFAVANLLTLLLYGALGGLFFFLPLNLIQVQGYTATETGAALLPFVLIMFVLSRWAGGLVKRYGSRIPLVIGPLVAAVGFALLAAAGDNAGYWKDFFPGIAVLGLGMTISVAPLTTTVMNAVGKDRMGIGSGVNNAAARAAGLLAIAIFGIIMLEVFARSLESRSNSANLPMSVKQALDHQEIKLAAIAIPDGVSSSLRKTIRQAIDEAFIRAFRTVMLLSSSLALAGGGISLFLTEDGKSSRFVT